MSAGRPRKPFAQKKAEGTARSRDKKEAVALEALALSPVLSITAPAWLPKTLASAWSAITADLCAMRSVIPGDLALLEQAFRMMANAATIQELLTGILEGGDDGYDVASISRLSAALVAQESAYERILGKFGITPSERSRLLTSLPRPKEPGNTSKDVTKYLP